MDFDDVKVGCPWLDVTNNTCDALNNSVRKQCNYENCAVFYWAKCFANVEDDLPLPAVDFPRVKYYSQKEMEKIWNS